MKLGDVISVKSNSPPYTALWVYRYVDTTYNPDSFFGADDRWRYSISCPLCGSTETLAFKSFSCYGYCTNCFIVWRAEQAHCLLCGFSYSLKRHDSGDYLCKRCNQLWELDTLISAYNSGTERDMLIPERQQYSWRLKKEEL